MVFNWEVGQVELGGSHGCCWYDGDNFLFFDCGALLSVTLDKTYLKLFCSLLDDGGRINRAHAYLQMSLKDSGYIGFEPGDSGTRNICFMGDGVQFIINIPIKNMRPMAQFLKKSLGEDKAE